MIYYLCVLVMTAMGSIASIHLKMASGETTIIQTIRNKHLYYGGILYVVAAVINVLVLRYLPYSVVLPLTSLTYIWTLLFSKIALREKINTKRIIGVVLIMIGAVFISISM